MLEKLSDRELALYRKNELGLEEDRFTVFLATGGNGANNHLLLLPSLLRHAAKLQVIAICGRNNETYNELMHWRSNHPELPMFIDGFTDVMHLLIQVSDVIVTRGGTTTCAKSLHYGCPILFNAFGGIMPQEKLTWKFFRNGARSRKIEIAPNFEAFIDDCMAKPDWFESYRKDFVSMQYHDDQTELIEDIIGLAEEVSGTEARRYPSPLDGRARD